VADARWGMSKSTFVLNAPERDELSARVRSRTLPTEDVRRSRLILMLADSNSYTVIQATLGCNRSYISQWKRRFERDGLAGLYSRHKGSKPTKKAMKLEVKILARVQQKPADGSTHWSVRKLAREVGTNPMRVSRVLRRAGHRRGEGKTAP
jgi:putative transposase